MSVQNWKRETKQGEEKLTVQVASYTLQRIGSPVIEKVTCIISAFLGKDMTPIATDSPMVQDILDAVKAGTDKSKSFGFEKVV